MNSFRMFAEGEVTKRRPFVRTPKRRVEMFVFEGLSLKFDAQKRESETSPICEIDCISFGQTQTHTYTVSHTVCTQ